MLLSDFNFQFKDRYDINDLIQIVKILRSDCGCPWDREQDHKSIRMDFLEETYEVLEAIDNGDPELLKEELGDVLLQVVFHSVLEVEAGRFDFDDVANDICQKLIYRHPHVFGDIKADNTDEVLKNWDKLKMKSKNQETYTDTLKSVPSVFPALMKSQKLAKRSKRAGFAVKDTDLINLVNMYQQSLSEDNPEITKDLLGKLLFGISAMSLEKGINAEEALEEENRRFILNFEKMENLIRLDGKDMNSLSIEELTGYWSKAQNEKKQ